MRAKNMRSKDKPDARRLEPKWLRMVMICDDDGDNGAADDGDD